MSIEQKIKIKECMDEMLFAAIRAIRAADPDGKHCNEVQCYFDEMLNSKERGHILLGNLPNAWVPNSSGFHGCIELKDRDI